MIAAGQSIGSYRILQKIGTGGMGAVYLAEHPLIGKKVALKVIHRDLANNKEVVQRFFQEAKAVTKIGNEHIIEIHDFGQTPEGDHFYIMEYLEGQTLAQLLGKERVLPAIRALHIGAQIAAALAAAHAAGVIHRDLKPDNVMLTPRLGDPDFVVLLDFGLAKMFQGAGGQSAVKTAAGVLLGTPQYMSPEACESRATIDHRTDVYALGVLLFQMMTGMLPFDGETMGEVLVKQVTQLAPPLRGYNPSIPPSVEQIVLRCLAKSPDGRFQTMNALREALLDPEAYLHNSPPILPARSLAPGEARVDAKTVMAYAAAEQAQKAAAAAAAAAPPRMSAGYPGVAPANNAAAKTMMADPGMAMHVPPPRAPTGPVPIVGQAPDMVSPAMPKMNTMRIATPVGYSSRPPRRMWPLVLVLALVLGVGGGAFAVAYFGKGKKTDTAAAASDAAVAMTTGSGSAQAGSATPPPTAKPDAGTPPSHPDAAVAVATGSAGSASAGSAAGSGSGSATAVKAGSGSGSAGTTATPIQTPNVPLATVVLDSTPQGAEVFDSSGKSVGKTPAKLSLPISDLPLEFELRLTGYRKKTKQLVVSGNTMVSVTLDKLPAATGSTGTGSKGTGTGTGKGSGTKKLDDGLERPD